MSLAASQAWVEAVPSHWRIARLKFVAKVQTGITLGQKYRGAVQTYPYLRVANVQAGRVRLDDVATVDVPEREAATALLKPGDVLMTEGGDIDKLGRGCVWNGQISPCLHQNHVFAVRPHGALPQWLALWTSAVPAVSYFENRAKRTTNLASISGTNVMECPLPVPPEHEQRQILALVDRETAKIDAMIGAKRRLVELLEEKRKAAITRAVTRGLTPDASMRDSGVQWVGEIPAHWETRRLAYMFRERDERNQPELPLLNVGIHEGVAVRQFSDEHIEQMAEDRETYQVACEGDIAFNKMRMWQGAVGVVPVTGLVSPDYTVAYPIVPLCIDYFGQLFRTGAFSAETARHSTGIVWDRLRLYWDGFRDIRVPVPPVEEQRAIVEHIWKMNCRSDEVKRAAERSIELLKERRRALISEAVTGRIHVDGKEVV